MQTQIQVIISLHYMDVLGSEFHGCCWSSLHSSTNSTIIRHMFCLSHSRGTTASGFRNCTWAVKSSYCGRRQRCSNGSPRIILISKTICQQTPCYSLVSIKKTLCCAVQTPLPTCHIMPQIHHTRSAIWHFRNSCHGYQLSDFSKLKRDVMMHMRCTWFCHSLESSSCCNWLHLGSSNVCANAGSSFGGNPYHHTHPFHHYHDCCVQVHYPVHLPIHLSMLEMQLTPPL